MNGLWVLFSKETFSQILKFLRVTEQSEQTRNRNDVPEGRYLEFRFSRDENKAKAEQSPVKLRELRRFFGKDFKVRY
jgi:hypothetical protein